MRRGYCVSSTTNGAWQIAHCEHRIGERLTEWLLAIG